MIILIGVIIAIQIGYFFSFSSPNEPVFDTEGEEIAGIQHRIDSLKQEAKQNSRFEIYPFNPNYISDYNAYRLGLSAGELTRLRAYRKQEKWVDSPAEFQQVTGVSDSLLATISPYFRFPEWVGRQDTDRSRPTTIDTPLEKRDLNSATAEELREVNGIGEVLSQRIVSYRDRLGGFLADEQLHDVYGLERDVVARTVERFTVMEKPVVEKMNINTASASDMATLPYISFELAREIVDYRILNNGIRDFSELKSIPGFPVQKFERIVLYLTLD